MNEYIDKREAKAEFCLWCMWKLSAKCKACNHPLDDVPTADVRPVVHGRWLKTDALPHRVYCSICYKTYVPNDRWQIWVDGDLPKDFCPNCGALMEG